MGYTILSQFLCRCIIVKKSNVEMNLELYIWVREEGGGIRYITRVYIMEKYLAGYLI